MADRQSRAAVPVPPYSAFLRSANAGHAVYRPTMFVTNNAGVYALEDYHVAVNRVEGAGRRPNQQLLGAMPPVGFVQGGLIVGLGGTLSANRRGELSPLIQAALVPIGSGRSG